MPLTNRQIKTRLQPITQVRTLDRPVRNDIVSLAMIRSRSGQSAQVMMILSPMSISAITRPNVEVSLRLCAGSSVRMANHEQHRC